jgi:translation elongation factor EF-G
MSLVLPDSRDKHYLINLFDTPGHVNFSDEVCASLRACDGMLLVVDVVEGVMLNTERMIRYAVHEDIAITVILNKVDRLCVELKLPPADAYLKLKHTLEEINGIIVQAAPHKEHLKLSPLLGNVAFGSGYYHNVFTLKSYARMYAKQYNLEASVFEKLLYEHHNISAGAITTITHWTANLPSRQVERTLNAPSSSSSWSPSTRSSAWSSRRNARTLRYASQSYGSPSWPSSASSSRRASTR